MKCCTQNTVFWDCKVLSRGWLPTFCSICTVLFSEDHWQIKPSVWATGTTQKLMNNQFFYLSQHGETRRVPFWLLQLYHSDPAILIEVLLIIIITKSQRMHLERRQRGQMSTSVHVTIGNTYWFPLIGEFDTVFKTNCCS